jgi:hypothetical protein
MGIWSYLFPGDEGDLADLFWSNRPISSGITLNNQVYTATNKDDTVNFAQPSLFDFSFNPYQSEVKLLEGNDSVRTAGTSSGTKFFLGDGDDFFTALDGLRFSRVEGGAGDDIIWIKESFWDREGLYRSILTTDSGNDYILIEKEDRLTDSRAAFFGGGIFAGDGDGKLIIRGNGLLSQSSGSLLTYSDGSTSLDGIINLGEGSDFLGIEKWNAPPTTGSLSTGISPYLLDSDINLGAGNDTADLRSLDFSSSTGVLIKGGDGYDVAILPLNISTAPNWLQGFEAFTYTINNGNGTAGAIAEIGALQEGVTLSAGNISGDPDGNGSITAFQWYLNNAVISGATSATYTTSSTGFGSYRVDLTYIDGQAFATTVVSADLVVSKINNGNGTASIITAQGNATFLEGVTLLAGNINGDPDGNGSVTAYQWYFNNAVINGATAAAYKTSATGFGNYRVDISYIDGQSFTATMSSADQLVSKGSDGIESAKVLTDSGYALQGPEATGTSIFLLTNQLGQLTATTALKAESRRLLDSYKVNDPISGTTKQASAADAMYIDFTIKTGALKSLAAEIALDREVKANAYVKVNPNTGEAFDFTFDPITGLGAQLLDNNKNGLVDTLKIYLQDGATGDVDGLVNGEIRDPGILADAPRQSVYRFFKASKGVHFYTSSDAERAIVNANPEWGYKDEGVAYDALVTQGKALHRFFNAKASYHFMTTNDEEAKTVKANPGWGYSYEGQSFNVSTIPQLGMSTPVNRFYRVLDGVGQHFYTASADEASNINANPAWGYKSEGVAWYV